MHGPATHRMDASQEADAEALHDVAVARSLSDGRPHRIGALVSLFDGRADSHGVVSASLARLAARGMRLAAEGDLVATARFIPLDAQALDAALASTAPHWHGRMQAVADSTNAVLAADLRAGGLALPCLLATEMQLAGRGRRGRDWRSAPGASLTASYALQVARPIAALEGVSLVCGLAMRDVLVEHGIDARLKWPNDVLVDGRKLAGILVETSASPATALVVGIGVNVMPLDDQATDDGDPATLAAIDLETAGWRDVDRHRLAAEVAVRLDARLEAFVRSGFAPMQDDFNAADAFHGRRVVLKTEHGQPLVGTERGVDAGGALVVDCDGRPVRCVAGDVSLRLAPS